MQEVLLLCDRHFGWFIHVQLPVSYVARVASSPMKNTSRPEMHSLRHHVSRHLGFRHVHLAMNFLTIYNQRHSSFRLALITASEEASLRQS